MARHRAPLGRGSEDEAASARYVGRHRAAFDGVDVGAAPAEEAGELWLGFRDGTDHRVADAVVNLTARTLAGGLRRGGRNPAP